MSARRHCVPGLLLTAGLALAAAPARARFDVGIIAPPAGQPLFGTVEVVAEPRGGAAARLELWVDGHLVAQLAAPPWRATIELGYENVEHRIRVVVHGVGGETASAELVSPIVQVHEVVELELQQLYVTAERAGAPVTDLERDDFRIVEGGLEQRLVTFERGDVPLTAVLLIDSSTSMRGGPLASALGGARAFAAAMAPLDEAQLVLFSDQVVHRTPFTADPAALVHGLTGAEARGGSAIVDHLALALFELEQRQGRRVAVLLSDGVDVDSVLGARDLAELAGRSPALLYWIRLRRHPRDAAHRSVWRDFDEHARELAELERLIEASGGRVLDIADVTAAAAAFREILAELRRQYVLGWYPEGLRHDGSWRRFRVEVARPGVELRARDGYFDD